MRTVPLYANALQLCPSNFFTTWVLFEKQVSIGMLAQQVASKQRVVQLLGSEGFMAWFLSGYKVNFKSHLSNYAARLDMRACS